MRRRVQSGDPLRISAADFNDLMEAAALIRRWARTGEVRGLRTLTGAMVSLRNDSEQDLLPGEILALRNVVTRPRDDRLDPFHSIVIAGRLPEHNSETIAVLVDAIPKGKIGLGIVGGVALAKINESASGYFAYYTTGSKRLSLGNYGDFPVLWSDIANGYALVDISRDAFTVEAELTEALSCCGSASASTSSYGTITIHDAFARVADWKLGDGSEVPEGTPILARYVRSYGWCLWFICKCSPECETCDPCESCDRVDCPDCPVCEPSLDECGNCDQECPCDSPGDACQPDECTCDTPGCESCDCESCEYDQCTIDPPCGASDEVCQGCDSPGCESCDCESCEYDVCTGCDPACDPCEVCYTCDSCVECEPCDTCDSECSQCDPCDPCEVCYTCDSCVECEPCDTCDSECSQCDPCDPCETCYTCDVCVGCDTCDTCDSECSQCDTCDTCETCYTCDVCVGCDIECSQCYACDRCEPDTCCQTCQACDAVCQGCDSECEVCYSCEPDCQTCYSCDPCDPCECDSGCMPCEMCDADTCCQICDQEPCSGCDTDCAACDKCDHDCNLCDGDYSVCAVCDEPGCPDHCRLCYIDCPVREGV